MPSIDQWDEMLGFGADPDEEDDPERGVEMPLDERTTILDFRFRTYFSSMGHTAVPVSLADWHPEQGDQRVRPFGYEWPTQDESSAEYRPIIRYCPDLVAKVLEGWDDLSAEMYGTVVCAMMASYIINRADEPDPDNPDPNAVIEKVLDFVSGNLEAGLQTLVTIQFAWTNKS